MFSLANQDPLLALPDRSGRSGRIVPTPLYTKLLERAKAVRPICIVIDNVADVYGGSEIDRSEVRQFITLARQIAHAANGYVIMSAHPSLAGIASKTGLSGSTQWHNSVRACGRFPGRDKSEMILSGLLVAGLPRMIFMSARIAARHRRRPRCARTCSGHPAR